MTFTMNDEKWEIKEVDKQYLIDRYNKEHEEPCTYAFGLCDYPNHIIWITDELCVDQKRRTLLHELMHCYLWCYGANIDNLHEENICDYSASAHYIIHKIILKIDNHLHI